MIKRNYEEKLMCKPEAVSYTHLDVYKRQGRTYAAGGDSWTYDFR